MSHAIYIVTANALNLRAAASAVADKLGVMPAGAMAVRDGDSNDPAWLKVVWNGLQGYAAAKHLRLQGNALPPLSPVWPASPAIPAAPSVEARDRDMAHLHPVVRTAVTKVLEHLNSKDIPFAMFEGYRTPERQAWLYGQGRTRAGGVVTHAEAWESYHQYGLACDLVLFENGRWSWDDSGPRRAWWAEMQKVAKDNGLRSLKFELPHVEHAGPTWRELQAGAALPDGGDLSWFENYSLAALRWRKGGRGPSAPPVEYAERPGLPTA